MLVVYLLFLLHLSAASTCGATSRNHRLFLPGGAAAPAPSPTIHDHRSVAISKDYYLSYYNVRHYHPVMMARRGGPPPPQPSPGARVEGAPPPPPPGVEASGVEGAPPPPPPPPQKEDRAAAMEPSPPPPPQQADGGGGEGGTSSEVDTGTDDVAVDYEGPKTHPPSHN